MPARAPISAWLASVNTMLSDHVVCSPLTKELLRTAVAACRQALVLVRVSKTYSTVKSDAVFNFPPGLDIIWLGRYSWLVATLAAPQCGRSNASLTLVEG